MVTLRAGWEVKAGLIPMKPMHEYSKAWHYTSEDYEKDGGVRGAIYASKQKEASTYAEQLQAGGLNWTANTYIWL